MSATKTHGGQSMARPLRRVVIGSPETAGWSDATEAARWKDLSYLHDPQPDLAIRQHGELRRLLSDAGIEILDLPAGDGLSMDSVYAHDASFVTDHGMILMSMGKAARRGEPAYHGTFYGSIGVPVLGTIEAPGQIEGGDIVWLDDRTLLVGRGYRTNASGIEQMRTLLTPGKIEVIEAPLPHGQGPGFCLHLMSLISILDERVAIVDLPWLAVSTVELLRRKDFRLIEIDPTERDSMACNVLSLGDKKLIAIEENRRTNARLREHGFEVGTFHGSEISHNGGGGPTCLTRPILRT